MAEQEISITFKINGIDQEIKSVEDLGKALNNTAKETKKAAEEATIFGDLKDRFSKLTEPIRKVITSMKTLKGALAATGIGALVLAIGTLIEYFRSSEEGSRKLAIATEALGILMGKLSDVAQKVGEFLVDLFTNPMEYLKEFANLIKENIINRFEGLLELVPQLSKAIGLLFKGEFAEAGKVAADAVGKVTLGVENVTDKVADAIEGVKEFGKEFVKEVNAAVKAATTLVDAQRALRNQQQALIKENAKLNQTLELQQKIAEDTTLSYEDRKAALEEVGKAQVALAANLQKQAAAEENIIRLQLAQEGNYEKKEELETQLAEAIAARTDAETQLLIKRQEADKITRELDLEELDRKRSIADAITALQNELVTDTFERARQELAAQEEAQMAELTRLRATEEEKQQIADLYAQKREKLAEEEAKFKIEQEEKVKENQLMLASSAFGAISKLVGEGTAVGKAAAIAQTTIDTYAAAQAAYKSQLALATPDAPVRAAIAAGIAIANGLANVRAIVATKTPGGEAAGGSVPTKPNFQSLTGGQNFDLNQAGNAAGTQRLQQVGTQVQPVRAYVVASEMTSQQEADRQIQNLSRLGNR